MDSSPIPPAAPPPDGPAVPAGRPQRRERRPDPPGCRVVVVYDPGTAERLRARAAREGRSLHWYHVTAIGAYLDAADAAEAGR